MKYYHDEFDISITGNKNGIIRMLNAAIRNVGTGNVILKDDDEDTINEKIGESGLTVSIIDLIDEEGLRDSIIQEKKHDFEKKLAYYQDVRDGKVPFDSQDEAEYAMYKADEMLDNMSDGRMIELTGVIESNDALDLEVSMKFDLGEELGDLSCPDWADWVDICRLYGRQVIVKDVQFLNDHFDEYCCCTIYKKTDDGSVNTTEFRPAQSVNNYIDDLRKIREENPQSEGDIIRDIEVKIKKLQAELSERKLMVAVDRINETEGHLQVPEGVTIIDGITSGENGEDIKSIYIPASVNSISKWTISSSNIKSIEISPENPSFCSVNNCILNKEKTKLLIGCKGSVIPAGIIEIEDSAFSGCKGLKDIVIPGSVKTIGNNAFDWCRELESVEIGDGVQEIGGSAFCSCAALKDISIPDSVTGIYGNAFYGCPCEAWILDKYKDKIN